MEFQIQWNAAEFSAAQFDSLRLHPWRAARGFIYPLLFVLVGLIMLAVGQWRGGATFFLIGIAFIAFTLTLARWRWGRTGKKLAAAPAIACTADSHGLVLRTANTVETHSWSDFSSMLDAPVSFDWIAREGKHCRCTCPKPHERLATGAIGESVGRECRGRRAATRMTPMLEPCYNSSPSQTRSPRRNICVCPLRLRPRSLPAV